MEAQIGHNSEGATRVAKDQLRSIVERIERLDSEIKALRDDQKDIYSEAKGNGYCPKALRTVVSRRKADAKKLAEHEAQVDLYMVALASLVRPA